MSSQLVFLTLFLGLIAGPRRVDVQVGPAVRSVRMMLDGRQVAVLQQPPWGATVDFGPSIAPAELVAVGYDDQGRELARVKQTVNVPRPTAEFVIALQNDANGVPVAAQFRWEHLLAAKPVTSTLTVDGKSVPLDRSAAAHLPALDMTHPHVIAGEIRFDDGFVTRRELVVGGAVGDTADAELTPVAVRQTAAAPPADLGDCFTSAGVPVRVAAVEKSPALIVVVLDPDTREAMRLFPSSGMEVRHLIALDAGTWMRVLWPVAERFKTTSNAPALLFPPSKDLDSSSAGLVWVLTRMSGEHAVDSAPRQFADAAGVAGLNAITGAHRRAVVLVLSPYKDQSVNGAASIRHYLASIGVPLFVWSLGGAAAELRESWGEIQDVSSTPRLNAAAERIRREVATQRVAWVAADPVSALRIQPTGRCGITPLAAAQPLTH